AFAAFFLTTIAFAQEAAKAPEGAPVQGGAVPADVKAPGKLVRTAPPQSGPGQPAAPGQPGTPPGGDAKPAEGTKEKENAPKTNSRPQKPELPPNPEELKVRPDANGRVRFNFQGQPWLEVLEWLARISGLSLDWQELPGDFLNLRTQRSYTL